MSRATRPPDAVIAKRLVRKRLKIRNRMLTFGEWMEGWGVKVDEEEDDGVIFYQIVVLHDDKFIRTYNVNEKEFEVVEDTTRPEQAGNARFKGTECLIDSEKDEIPEERLKKLLKSRPFRGGCEKGKHMVASKGNANMAGTRIQYWDTTQATWYAGRILGMWRDKPRTHWLVMFDDETEYAVCKADDVWKLDWGETLIEGSAAAGHVRLSQFGNDDKKLLEFVLETTAPMHRLHVKCWQHGVQVFQAGKRPVETAQMNGNARPRNRQRISNGASSGEDGNAKRNGAQHPTETADQSSGAIPGSRLWVLTSPSSLVPSQVQVSHTVGVLKVTIPIG